MHYVLLRFIIEKGAHRKTRKIGGCMGWDGEDIFTWPLHQMDTQKNIVGAQRGAFRAYGKWSPCTSYTTELLPLSPLRTIQHRVDSRWINHVKITQPWHLTIVQSHSQVLNYFSRIWDFLFLTYVFRFLIRHGTCLIGIRFITQSHNAL